MQNYQHIADCVGCIHTYHICVMSMSLRGRERWEERRSLYCANLLATQFDAIPFNSISFVMVHLFPFLHDFHLYGECVVIDVLIADAVFHFSFIVHLVCLLLFPFLRTFQFICLFVCLFVLLARDQNVKNANFDIINGSEGKTSYLRCTFLYRVFNTSLAPHLYLNKIINI